MKFPELEGKTITAVFGLFEGSETVEILLSDGTEIFMFHKLECCEYVYLEDICGFEEDLVGATILHFEERSSITNNDIEYTFYDIQTTKGCVNLRWNGTSNGNYSTAVTVEVIPCLQS